MAQHPPGDTIHTLYTSNGSPYQNFQGRIHYASYKLVQKMPGENAAGAHFRLTLQPLPPFHDAAIIHFLAMQAGADVSA